MSGSGYQKVSNPFAPFSDFFSESAVENFKGVLTQRHLGARRARLG